jgi:small GTP-binding protein
MNIVITGHIDHGKSTLIGRLLFDTGSFPESLVEEITRVSHEKGKDIEFAYFLDSLEEERLQNITIDTTQTYFKTDTRRYTIIDAPGHREFLKNMVSGASIADAAILMVDAGRGIEEQTRRHASILNLIGIQRLIVALNKMDTVEYSEARYNELKTQVMDLMGKVGLKPTHIVPISAKDGENIVRPSAKMAWNKVAPLLTLLDQMPEPMDQDAAPLRVPVQDVYNVEGKQMFVGRVESGVLRPGAKVNVYPGNIQAVVESVQVWGKTLTEARSGFSIGFTLKDGVTVKRGNVLGDTTAPITTKQLNTVVFALSGARIEANQPLTLRCATQAVPCKISNIAKRMDSSSLEILDPKHAAIEETEVGEVTISADSDICINDFHEVPELGRFVLTRENGEIAAAGVVRL